MLQQQLEPERNEKEKKKASAKKQKYLKEELNGNFNAENTLTSNGLSIVEMPEERTGALEVRAIEIMLCEHGMKIEEKSEHNLRDI